ncbi:hypothetical protein H5A34_12395 [Pectobacterium brasiliense]|uniref:hypothetical protein n=1 Tax=Pectobacterium brasiliense TaxID=180957 RepID=UPI001968C0CA|nr:hypothetical protein [Pectobacterium brasiliense]MBN3069901.1 hypothetical protein [Pectobacterium brasiliense]MBN3246949.1 hypothetical protein [Pectobacterium brasiliense]
MNNLIKNSGNVYNFTLEHSEEIRQLVISLGVIKFYREFLINFNPTEFLHFCMAIISYIEECEVYDLLLSYLSPEDPHSPNTWGRGYHRLFDMDMNKVENRVNYLRSEDNIRKEMETLSQLEINYHPHIKRRL